MSPCNWVPDFTGCTSGPCCVDVDTDPAIKTTATTAAIGVLWALTGRRFGVCSVTVRPCKPNTCRPESLADVIFWNSRDRGNMGVGIWEPILTAAGPINIACGCPTGCCSCHNSCEVLLPGPVRAITNVTVAGVVLNPATYSVYGNRKLVFYPDASGNSVCPPCQDYDKPLGQAGTWSVTYTAGETVPAELLLAAGMYACELAKAMIGDQNCSLPSRVSNVSRQGIDVGFIDPLLLVDAGLTGLRFVDDVIRALNPYRMHQPARVFSPDMFKTERPS